MSDLISRDMAIKESYQIEVDGSSIDVVQVETLMALPSASSWIRVQDRFPDNEELVLVFTKSGDYDIDMFFVDDDPEYGCYGFSHHPDVDEVVAWLHLPKPYEPKE